MLVSRPSGRAFSQLSFLPEQRLDEGFLFRG